MKDNLWNQTHEDRGIDFQRPWYLPAISLLSYIEQSTHTIVEIGCGNGEFASIVMQRYPNSNYSGLEGFHLSAKEAKKFNIDVVISEFEYHLPILSSNADFVIALEVIEHIARTERLIEEIHRILKPEGYLIISTPNVGHFYFRLKYLFRAEVPCEGIHLRFFNQKLLLGLMRDAGFVIIKKKSITPLIGYNRLCRILWHSKPKFIDVLPNLLEGALALHFIWLLKKQ